MRLLERNLRTVYYRNRLDHQPIFDDEGYETGEYENRYSDLYELKCNVSAADGTAQREVFGNLESYHKILLTDDMGCDFNEQTIFYIDVIPSKETEYASTPDYIVAGIARSLNYISVALRKAETKGTL